MSMREGGEGRACRREEDSGQNTCKSTTRFIISTLACAFPFFGRPPQSAAGPARDQRLGFSPAAKAKLCAAFASPGNNGIITDPEGDDDRRAEPRVSLLAGRKGDGGGAINLISAPVWHPSPRDFHDGDDDGGDHHPANDDAVQPTNTPGPVPCPHTHPPTAMAAATMTRNKHRHRFGMRASWSWAFSSLAGIYAPNRKRTNFAENGDEYQVQEEFIPFDFTGAALAMEDARDEELAGNRRREEGVAAGRERAWRVVEGDVFQGAEFFCGLR
ncbi:hypothetical protein BDK51DRAFT_37206 [Blyttiomyces helicus]|uniref:Uncharacterized protein n=1 Tax=Blyttiomyces helicus TaxID=388810 RepID=A0A4P9WBM9_9FUNG|nr:hypothetical protein BDK51DRAFT_37206 [Blyttiomyces helicus]|eukprot:RKO88963.1 hypothetical protein BDK51DRAFT_37206 [Blyttiomyces helicus]